MLKETVIIVCYPGCISFEVALAAELLSSKFQIITTSPDGQELQSNPGIPINIQQRFSEVDLRRCKAVLVPGGDPGSLVGNKEIDQLLFEANERGILIGGICAGPSVLAKAGILKGRRIAHGYGSAQLDFLKEIFAEVILTEDSVIVDRNIITAKPDAYIDFALEIAIYLNVVNPAESKRLREYYRGSRGLTTEHSVDHNKKAGKYARFELERKFRLKSMPEALRQSKEFKVIEDRYFSDTNLRLRIVSTSDGQILERKLTQKFVPQDSDFTKTQITNLYLNDDAHTLLAQLPGSIIKKRRYKFTAGENVFSVDQFDESFGGLILAEIEFESEEAMKNFVSPFPDWKDVSLEKNYSGGNLAIMANENRIHKGSCLCGCVTFEVSGPLPQPTSCHCSHCRKHSGHFEASVDIPRANLTLHGAEKVAWYQSSEKVRRGFCSTCGSSLFWDPVFREWTSVAMGAFDGPTHTKLSKHIFVADKGDYYEIADGLPQDLRPPTQPTSVSKMEK